MKIDISFPGEKLVIKLWQTLAEKGIGSLLQPWHEKRLAATRNEIRKQEMLMLADAEAKAEQIRLGKASISSDGRYLLGKDVDLTDDDRVEPVINFESVASISSCNDISTKISKEINLSKAIFVAENILSEDNSDPSSVDVDSDWLFSWKENAGRVSSDELQNLWGRILAGEVKNPGTYSLRALEFLRCIDRSDAKLIEKLASLVVDGRVFRNQIQSTGYLSFDDLLYLQELGVVGSVDVIGLNTTWNSDVTGSYQKGLICHNKILVVRHSNSNKPIIRTVYIITKLGSEIISLGDFEANEDYLIAVGKELVAEGYQVQLGDWEAVSSDYGRVSNAYDL